MYCCPICHSTAEYSIFPICDKCSFKMSNLHVSCGNKVSWIECKKCQKRVSGDTPKNCMFIMKNRKKN